MERETVTKSQKGKKAYVEMKVDSFFIGRQIDTVRKETRVVSVMTDKYKETCTVDRDEKGDRLLPHEGGEKSTNASGNRDESSFGPRERHSVPLHIFF